MSLGNSSFNSNLEDRYRAILEQSPFSIQIFAPDGSTILVNKAWEKLWGTTLEQIKGYNILADRQLVERGVMPNIRRAFAGEIVEIPPILYDPDETIPGATQNPEPKRWTKALIYPVKDPAGKILEVILVHEDITARVLAEEKLKASEARYRTLFETTPDGVLIVNEEGVYVDVNESYCRILKTSRENLIGTHFSRHMVPERLEDAKKAFADLREKGSFEGDFPMRAADGSVIELEWWSRANFMPGLHVCVARDVTERKRSMQERQRLARQVENQNQRLQAVISNVPGIVWEAYGEPDKENQRIDFINDYVEKMLGYTVEEWLSTPNFWLTIVHPDDRAQAARTAYETFKNKTTGINQFRWLTKDGKAIWVEAQSVTVLDESGNPIGMRGVTMDISRRKQQQIHERFLAEASTALASSLDYETTLATVAGLAVPHFADWCSVDMADADGSLIRLAVAHVDPEKIAWAHEIHRRYPPDPSDPQGVYNVLRTGSAEFYPEIPDEMLAQGARDEEHLRILRELGFRSAMIVPLKLRDRVFGVMTFVNSESRRHHTEEDLFLAEELARRAVLAIDNANLFRAEQQTRLAAERTSDFLRRLQSVSASLSRTLTPSDVAVAVIEQGVNSLGAGGGTVVLFDETGAELEIVETLGFQKEIVDRWRRFKLSQHVPLADSVRDKSPVIVESLEKYQEIYPELAVLASSTGSQALTAYPLVVEGRTIGAMGLTFPQPQNFTEDDRAFLSALAHQCAQALERARLYENEQRLRTQAEQANRMKDEFLATVSHELRTPLNAIVGWSNMLAAKRLSPDVAARALETIERNAKAQSQIIEDLLDVSRIITGKLNLKLDSVDLESIIKTTLQSLQPAAATKNIGITSKFDSAAKVIRGDGDRLQQIMWNLLSNAIKFTPEGGRVEVSLELVRSFVVITVRDTGQGISPEFLPYVFERFSQADSTTSRKFGGLGLGLAIVRHLVEMHGGTVKAESPGADKGTVFTVTLPVKAENFFAENFDQTDLPVSLPAKKHNPFSDKDLGNIRILVVDDDPDTRVLLATLLESCGAMVALADSAKEAIEAFRRFQPHLLISDIGMPDEDGYSLIQHIRNSPGGDIPAIALSAYARDEDRIKAEKAGFKTHVAKPFEPDRLIEIIKSIKIN